MTSLDIVKVIRGVFYLLVFLNSFRMKQSIFNNLRFKIMGEVFCPAFGSVERCDLALWICWYGMFAGLFNLVVWVLLAPRNKGKRSKWSYRFELTFDKLQIPLWIFFRFLIQHWTDEIESSSSELNWLLFSLHINSYFFALAYLYVKFDERNFRFLDRLQYLKNNFGA